MAKAGNISSLNPDLKVGAKFYQAHQNGVSIHTSLALAINFLPTPLNIQQKFKEHN